MRKRIWLIGLVAVIAAAIGLGSMTAFAQEKEEGSSRTGLIARVATILGLEEQQVQDAFDEARREMMDEMLDQRLAALVESGRITQDQADELREWYADRPDGVWAGGSFGRGKDPRYDRGHGFGGRGHFSFGRGHFSNKGNRLDKGETVPATPATAPAATPTAPADSSNSN